MRRVFYGIALCLIVLPALGCEKSDEQRRAEAIANLPEDQKLSFAVDQQGMRYLYRTGNGGTRSVLSLSAIPPGYRAAVAVFTGEKADRRAAEGELFVADLTDAAPGDEVVAVLADREHMERVSRVGALGAKAALSVVDGAGWMVELAPQRTRGPGEGRYVSFVIEDPRTGEVHEDRAFIKRGEPREEPEEEGVLDRTWGRVFGDSSDDERAAEAEAEWRPVVMYSAPWCPACKAAKKWLDQNDVPYEYKNVQKDRAAARELMKFCHARGLRPGAIPTFVIGEDEAMQGWNQDRFVGLAKK